MPRPMTAAVNDKVGVNSVLAWVDEARARTDFDTLKQAGFGWVREELHWSRLEPVVGQPFDWSRTDGMMTAARKAGVKVCVVFGLKNTQQPPLTSVDRGMYARYVRLCLERYPEIGAAEICNEPYYAHFWASPSPAEYAKLARATIPVIRATRPTVPILLVGDVPKIAGAGWLAGIQAADPGLIALADGLTIHPYTDPGSNGPNVDGDPRWTFKGQIDLAAKAGKPLWLTEFGWTTANAPNSVTEAKQAEYLVDAVKVALAHPAVARSFIYTWTTDGPTATDREQRYGLRRQDGTFKPAWQALSKLLVGEPWVPPAPPPTPPPPGQDRAATLAQARTHMARSSITYKTWLARKQSGYYKNPATTEWAKADALLDRLV